MCHDSSCVTCLIDVRRDSFMVDMTHLYVTLLIHVESDSSRVTGTCIAGVLRDVCCRCFAVCCRVLQSVAVSCTLDESLSTFT